MIYIIQLSSFSLQEKRVNCHSLFEDALAKLKSSKDVTAFQVKINLITPNAQIIISLN